MLSTLDQIMLIVSIAYSAFAFALFLVFACAQIAAPGLASQFAEAIQARYIPLKALALGTAVWIILKVPVSAMSRDLRWDDWVLIITCAASWLIAFILREGARGKFIRSPIKR